MTPLGTGRGAWPSLIAAGIAGLALMSGAEWRESPPPCLAAHSLGASSGAQSFPWAQPIEGKGLRNAYRVTKDIYRGAQPSAEGMKRLAEMGVKTIVNLRAVHSDRDEIGGLPLGCEHISMKAWHPEDEDVVRFLRIVTDRERLPAFVHCQYGSDRTGTMCAVYRIVVCGWPTEEAIREMKEGGFGYHPIWKKLVRYVRGLDVEAIKKEAGI